MDPAMAVFSSEQAIQAGQVRAPSLSCLTGESVLWQLEHALKHQREARIHVEYHIEQLQAELQRLLEAQANRAREGIPAAKSDLSFLSQIKDQRL